MNIFSVNSLSLLLVITYYFLLAYPNLVWYIPLQFITLLLLVARNILSLSNYILYTSLSYIPLYCLKYNK